MKNSQWRPKISITTLHSQSAMLQAEQIPSCETNWILLWAEDQSVSRSVCTQLDRDIFLATRTSQTLVLRTCQTNNLSAQEEEFLKWINEITRLEFIKSGLILKRNLPSFKNFPLEWHLWTCVFHPNPIWAIITNNDEQFCPLIVFMA